LVVEWCREQLDPWYKQKKISNARYSQIIDKCVHKVLNSSETWNATQLGLLYARQDKVTALVNAYIHKQHIVP